MNFIRQIVKNSLDFIAYSNLFLAFAVFCSTLQGGVIFNYASKSFTHFAIVNFMAAFFLYNLQRIYQSSYPTGESRLLWYRKNKKWIFTLGILFALLFSKEVWHVFVTYKQGILIYCMCAIFSILYFLPPFNLRKIPYIKQFCIAFVWVVVCCFIPLMYEAKNFMGLFYFQKDHSLYLISQFCFIAAMCVPFDIRDVEKDKQESTITFPVLLGINKSKIIAIVLLTIYFSLTFFMESVSLVSVRGIVFLAAGTVIYFSSPNRHRYYFVYLTDGVIILQALLHYWLL